jgi:hypothetical protein
MEGTDGFALGVPACGQGGESRVVARGLVGSPPGFQLVIPTLHVSCAADTDMSSPYGGMSISVRMVISFMA